MVVVRRSRDQGLGMLHQQTASYLKCPNLILALCFVYYWLGDILATFHTIQPLHRVCN